jgi:hypothetical protein
MMVTDEHEDATFRRGVAWTFSIVCIHILDRSLLIPGAGIEFLLVVPLCGMSTENLVSFLFCRASSAGGPT